MGEWLWKIDWDVVIGIGNGRKVDGYILSGLEVSDCAMLIMVNN